MSAKFKAGDKVKVLCKAESQPCGWMEAMDETVGKAGIVTYADRDGTYQVDVGGREWWYDAYVLGSFSEFPFAVGDVVTPNGRNTSEHSFKTGTEYVVTRVRKSARGVGEYQIHLNHDDNGNAYRHRPHDQFDLVRKAGDPVPIAEPTPYFLVSSAVQKFDTQHATAQDAKDWITEVGTPGTVYTIQEVRAVGTFSVVRELKEAA